MIVTINGIPIRINRKTIKNMHLYVKPPDGHVEVSAPWSLSDESVEMFIRSKIGWIKRQQENFSSQQRQTKREYVSGEAFYLWGVQYYLLVNYSNKGNSLVIDGDKAILTVRKESSALQRENYVNEWFRATLKKEVERLMPKWERQTGLHPNSWQTKNMTTRWGTCNVQSKKIWLNLQLAKKPVECLEYIILHELAHLKEKKHNAAFVAIVDRYMPNWKDVRKKLNDLILDYMDPSASIMEE